MSDKNSFDFQLKKRRGKAALIVLIGLILLMMITFIIYGAVMGLSALVEAVSQPEPQVETVTEPIAETEPEHLAPEIVGDKLLFRDSYLGEAWLPVLEGVPVSCIDMGKILSDKNGLKYYHEGDAVTSAVGIDVSYYQGKIDWEKVKAAGVEFVIIRLGYRGYESGEIFLDKEFENYIQGASDAGLDVGVYFFSQAINVSEAIEEAEFVKENIKEYELTYPVVFDWEIIGEETARTNEVSPETLTECAVAFCDNIKAAGYTPMVYSNKRQAYLKFDLRMLAGYDFWLADFNDETDFYYDYNIWQYSYTGIIDGIENQVDLNICFQPYKVDTEDKPADGETEAADETTAASEETVTAAETEETTADISEDVIEEIPDDKTEKINDETAEGTNGMAVY